MNRRSFLELVLAAGVSPAIVRAQSLMPVRFRRDEKIGLLLPTDVVYLDFENGDDANDGSSWALARRTLDGFGLVTGSTIYVNGGLHTGNDPITISECKINFMRTIPRKRILGVFLTAPWIH